MKFLFSFSKTIIAIPQSVFFVCRVKFKIEDEPCYKYAKLEDFHVF